MLLSKLTVGLLFQDAKQKLEVQMKQMRTGSTAVRKVEPRSRSVGSEFRNLGARPKNSNPRYAFRRERSMEDIDKDIETIWKELQELDKLPRSEDRMAENIKVERYLLSTWFYSFTIESSIAKGFSFYQCYSLLSVLVCRPVGQMLFEPYNDKIIILETHLNENNLPHFHFLNKSC
jgi:hypothetical protein